jgi:molybdopterin/thiamine biosynthesis adenylyltransferase/rhodanese-related sulfurtransferase
MSNLSDKEINRYQRQMIMPEIGYEGQKLLKKAKILMIGAGGLGCPILQYLSAVGIGEIGIVEDDVVDESNLHRQILYSPCDIGKLKAVIAKERLSFQNPEIVIEIYPVRLELDNAAQLIKDYDLVIDGSDNFETRYLVNDICVELNKPFVFGSIFKFEGQVSVFNYENGPTYRCLYPEKMENNSVLNCTEIGVLGVLPGIIGLLMANEAIKIICKIGENLSGKLLVYDALENKMDFYNIEKSNQSKVLKEEMDKTDISSEIELELLEEWTNTGTKFLLVDVRQEWEFEEFNRGGINIPLNDLPQNIDKLSNEEKIVFCCTYGNKSLLAINIIKEKYPEKEYYSIKDGIDSDY